MPGAGSFFPESPVTIRTSSRRFTGQEALGMLGLPVCLRVLELFCAHAKGVVFELKIDGFHALAHIEAGKGELIFRNGNVFRGFADLAACIAEHLRVESAVLDGETTCPDDSGRSIFRDLLFRNGQCILHRVRSAVPQRKRPSDTAAH